MAEPADPKSQGEWWRAGSEEAAQQIFNRYAERLVALARRRISQRLAGRLDPEDVVQSVFRTFFHRVREGQFALHDQDDLGKLLVRITVHKTLRKVAYHKAAKRNPGLEMGQGKDAQSCWEEIMDGEPSPDAAVAFLDQMENFMSQFQPLERQILEMRLQGYSNDEICQKLNTYDRKIRRVIERVQEVAEEEGLAGELGG